MLVSYCIIPSMYHSQKDKTMLMENRSVFAKDEQLGENLTINGKQEGVFLGWINEIVLCSDCGDVSIDL